MSNRKYLIILIAILVAGAVLRGLYLSEIVKHPDFRYPPVDAGYHDYWARSLVTGNWTPPPGFEDPQIRTTPFFRPPGYPYFLALLYLFTNLSYVWVRLLQMALGLVNCLLAWRIGRKWYGESAGLVFAGFMACYWSFIYYEGELLEPVLLITLALALVHSVGSWTQKTSLRNTLFAGVLLGLFALTRPNGLLFLPVILGWALWIARRRKDRAVFRAAAIGVPLGLVLTVVPACVRNYVAAHDFVPISSNLGINLYLGNCAQANGMFTSTPEVGTFGTCYDYPRVVRSLERKLGRPLTHSQVSDYFTRRALTYITAHPTSTVELAFRRSLLFWGPREVSHNKEEELERAHSSVLRKLPGGFALVLSLFLTGLMVLLLDRRREALSAGQDRTESGFRYEVSALIVLFAAVYFLSFLPFFVTAQYRVPVIPLMMAVGSYGVCRTASAAVGRDFRRVMCWVLPFVIVYPLASRDFTGYHPDAANWHYLRGVALDRDGKTARALWEYEQALRIKPDWADLHNNIGSILARQGRTAEAIEHYSTSLKLDPGGVRSLNNLGVVLDEQGKTDEAIRVYRTVLRVVPDDPAAHNNLAVAFFLKGRYRDAWKEVKLCRTYGGSPSPRLTDALSEKMTEPR